MERRKFLKDTSILAAGATVFSSFKSPPSQRQQIIPKALRRGDTIALTAPAGAIFNKSHIEKMERRLKNLGFKTLKGRTLYEQNGFLAGTDDFRAQELHDLFKNKTVNAILSMRGGWGCARLLDKLDYNLIKTNPKIIMGYSDITSLLIAITNKTGLITYHGPVGYSSWKDFSTEQVMNTLSIGSPFVMQNPSFHLKELATLSSGKAQGQLIGGNLTVVASMIGTQHEPDWTDKILFLEETGEEPYRIDRLLWQLKQANVFKKINGVILGAFSKCEAEEPTKSFTLIDILNQHFKNKNYPVYKGAAFGHIVPKFTLPIGVNVEIDADQYTITLLERSVI